MFLYNPSIVPSLLLLHSHINLDFSFLNFSILSNVVVMQNTRSERTIRDLSHPLDCLFTEPCRINGTSYFNLAPSVLQRECYSLGYQIKADTRAPGIFLHSWIFNLRFVLQDKNRLYLKEIRHSAFPYSCLLFENHESWRQETLVESTLVSIKYYKRPVLRI